MKSALIIAVLGISVGFVACKKTINCETPVIKRVMFYTSNSANRIPDTSAELVKYRKSSGFTQVSEVFPSIKLTNDGYDKYMEFPEKGKETYDYNWEIKLKPSNRIYKLSKIDHESATSKTHSCTNTVSYEVNDSLATVPGNPYSSTPNFLSDIQIMYW